jgi:hypothetical protein
MKPFSFLLLLFLSTSSRAADPVHYTLEYYSGNDFLTVSIQLPKAAGDQADSLIIPRSAPGTYAMTDYAAFVEQVTAITGDGVTLRGGGTSLSTMYWRAKIFWSFSGTRPVQLRNTSSRCP